MKILVADDELDVRRTLERFLSKLGHEVVCAGDGGAALRTFHGEAVDLVITDIRMPGLDGLELLHRIKKTRRSYAEVIVITGHGDAESAIQALRSGAYDYLQKPIDVRELAIVVERYSDYLQMRARYLELDSAFQKEVERATEIVRGRADKLREAYLQEVGLGDVLVYSDAFRAVIELAEKFSSDRSLPVLIEGESGTGKDVIARYIHYFSQGMTVTPFVAINCGAVAPGLFEAELFGHEAGAFTGATASGREGKLEAAQGGTVFLDEIGEMPAELQVKLLRVLESRRLYRVGGVKEIPIDVRIIAATNKDLSKEVQEDRFRLDLYYRLNVAHLRIPPLRERREDILPLALKFAASASARRGRPFGGFSSAGERYLSSLPWPGNVRQLKNAMERLALLGPWDCVDEEALSFIERFGLERVRPCEGGFVLGRDAFDLPEEGFDLDDLVKRIVSRALEKNHGNQTATASFLRLSRRVLQGKLQKRSGSAA